MLRRIEGALLLVYGGFLNFLIYSGRYKFYMNPKFMWLTFLSSCVLLIYGIYGMARPPEKVNKVFLSVIFLFILMAVLVPARELGVEDMLFKPF